MSQTGQISGGVFTGREVFERRRSAKIEAWILGGLDEGGYLREGLAEGAVAEVALAHAEEFRARPAVVSFLFHGLIHGAQLGDQAPDRLVINDSLWALIKMLAAETDGQLRWTWKG